ncbi:MAG: vitamin K epoxide reductase family protein [Chloroflexi bacterium]|nr:vitamin K epoxide reductase family protein [Chloroflexota bacterium]MBV9603201.1 vitamin K epoxide reductase family protein [Chloroflexota bacterium]
MRGRLWPALLGVAGLLISAYLVGTHYFAEQVPLACATGGIVDCEQVTSSAESMVGPMPVAVLGLVWFAVFLGILAARRWWPQALALQVVWSVAGLLSVFYLVYAELFLIGAICLWCTAVHAIVVALFLMTVWDATAPTPSTENLGDRLRTLG